MAISAFKFRIGAKLAISAGLGVILVGVMLGFQHFGGSAVERATDTALEQRRLSQVATDMKASVRGMMIGLRDIRLAQTAEDLKKAEAYLHAREDSVVKFLNEAAKLVRLPEDRERIEKARSLASTYKSVGKDIATEKAELFALGGKLNGNAWRAQYATVLKAPEFSKSAKAREIETALRDAEDSFNDARTAGWRYAATSDAAQAQRTGASSDRSLATLRKLGGEIDDKSLARLVEGLIQPVTDYKTGFTRYVQLNGHIAALVRDRGLPTASEMGAIADKIVSGAI